MDITVNRKALGSFVCSTWLMIVGLVSLFPFDLSDLSMPDSTAK